MELKKSFIDKHMAGSAFAFCSLLTLTAVSLSFFSKRENVSDIIRLTSSVPFIMILLGFFIIRDKMRELIIAGICAFLFNCFTGIYILLGFFAAAAYGAVSAFMWIIFIPIVLCFVIVVLLFKFLK